MKKSSKSGVDRRKFLKAAAVGGVATLVASSGTAGAQQLTAPAKVPAVSPRDGTARGSRGFDSGSHRFRLHG